MDSELHNLLVEIRDTISSYMNEGLSFELARKKYNELAARYDELEKKYTPAHGSDLKGLLYQHNINNFSKCTALYGEEDVRMVTFVGNDVYNSTIVDIINREKNLIAFNEVSEHFLEKQDVLIFKLYIYSFLIENSPFYFTAVTSSTFFQKEKFEHLGEIMQQLYNNRKTKALVFNYVDDILQALEKHIDCFPEKELYADIFVFDTIAHIFGHLSQISISNISAAILQTLEDSYPGEAEVLLLSFSNCVVLHDASEAVPECKRIEFKHNHLPITYRAIRVKVDKSKPLNLIFDEIYNFEQYVIEGDIQV